MADVDEQIGRGEFAPIREWLREHIHRHGRKFLGGDARACGAAGLDPEPYLNYLRGEARGRMKPGGVPSSGRRDRARSSRRTSRGSRTFRALPARGSRARARAGGAPCSGRHEFSARARGHDRRRRWRSRGWRSSRRRRPRSRRRGVAEGHWPGATVMTVQNGLGAEEVVRRHGDWPLLSAVTFMSGTKHADTARGVHPRHGDMDRPLRRHAALDARRARRGADRRVGTEGRGAADLRPAQWSKLIFNATVNGRGADGTPARLPLRRPRTRSPISVTSSTA